MSTCDNKMCSCSSACLYFLAILAGFALLGLIFLLPILLGGSLLMIILIVLIALVIILFALAIILKALFCLWFTSKC